MNLSTIPTYVISNLYYEHIINNLQNQIEVLPIYEIKTDKFRNLVDRRNNYHKKYQDSLIYTYSTNCMHNYVESNSFQKRIWVDNTVKSYLLSIDAEAITLEQFKIDVMEHLKIELLLKNV